MAAENTTSGQAQTLGERNAMTKKQAYDEALGNIVAAQEQLDLSVEQLDKALKILTEGKAPGIAILETKKASEDAYKLGEYVRSIIGGINMLRSVA